MEETGAGDQAGEAVHNVEVDGAQAMIDDADLLDYEPEEDDLHSNSQKDSTLNTANNGRLKIVVTDSSLHEQWEESMLSAEVGWIVIPGARINELTAAWKIEYLEEPRPMDVVLLGGLHNIVRGSPGPNIVVALRHFVDLVSWQGEHFHPEVPNTCAIGTLSYPPSVCWFEDDGPVPHDFNNQLRNMKWLNMQIERINSESGIKAPNFPALGVRKETRLGRGITRHRLQHWQGSSRGDKLFPNTELKKKMCRQIGKYFVHNTGNDKDQATE